MNYIILEMLLISVNTRGYVQYLEYFVR